MRCPVKLYEFYLSKCPESAKDKDDMFYLQPVEGCEPDSPVWYSAEQGGGPQEEGGGRAGVHDDNDINNADDDDIDNDGQERAGPDPAAEPYH